MKKGLLLVLAVLLVAGLFVSCNSDVSANAGASSKDYAYVTFDKASASKSVSPTVDPADAPSIDDLYWYYKAIKASGTVHEGERTEWTRVNSSTGLSGTIGPFSVGEWYFALVGMKTETAPAVTYTIDENNNVAWANYSGTDARYIGISGTEGYEKKVNVTLEGNQSTTYIPMSLQQVNMTDEVTVKLDGLVLVGNSGITEGSKVWLDVLKGTSKLGTTIAVEAGASGAVVPTDTSREFELSSAVEQVTLNFKLYDKEGGNAPVVKEASVSFLATKGATVTLAGSLDAIEVYGSFDPVNFEAYVVSSTGAVAFYASLGNAIDAAANGDTVGLLQNVTSPQINIVDKSIALNGNGYILTSSASNNTSYTGTGASLSDYSCFAIALYTSEAKSQQLIDDEYGPIQLTVENLKIESQTARYGLYFDGYVVGTVDSCDISIPGSSVCSGGYINGNHDVYPATVTVKGSEIGYSSGNNVSEWMGTPLSVSGGGILIVDGGIYHGNMSLSTFTSGGKITVNSGTFTGKIKNYAIASTYSNLKYAADGTSVNSVIEINGGNFTSCTFDCDSGTSTTITGGTFSTDPSTYVATGYQADYNGDGTWTVSAVN